jgi:hypothetical protein
VSSSLGDKFYPGTIGTPGGQIKLLGSHFDPRGEIQNCTMWMFLEDMDVIIQDFYANT